MNFAKSLFEIARKDLEAAKCLFERELYPQAVFYLQQSIEKATKSWGLANNIIKEDDLIGVVGHAPLKVYMKPIKEQKEQLGEVIGTIQKDQKLKDLTVVKKFDVEKYYKVTADILTMIESSDKGSKEIPRSQEGLIRSVIKDLDKLESQEAHLKLLRIPTKDFYEIKKDYTELLDMCHDLNLQNEYLKELLEGIVTLRLMRDLNRVIRPPIKNATYVEYSLFYLSLIMFPHAIITRYPFINHDPLKLYNQNLPLIQLFDDLVKIMDKTLSKLGNLLSEY